MTDLQAAKAVVRTFYEELDAASPEAAADVVSRYSAEGFRWRGSHPFGEIEDPRLVAETFWTPFKRAFTPMQRRETIFFAGRNWLDEQKTVWVCSMGHLLGNFSGPWLSILPTGRLAYLRYCEFHRIEGGRIAESSLHIDVMGILLQAGSTVVPAPTGVVTMTPGPLTQDGLLFDACPEEEGIATIELINRMLKRLISSLVRTTAEDLTHDWHDDMLWWGPAGIGASFAHQGYLKGHSGPFEQGLEFVRHNGHVMRIAEGHYGGFFGYPSLTVRPSGGYLGLTTASDRTADMRIVDLYRRSGDKIAENWIFIDHLWFLKQLGFDLLERHRALHSPQLRP